MSALPPWVWLDGRLVPTAEARVSPYDRGLLLGDGLYETVRVHRGRGFRAAQHVARLVKSADWLGLALAPEDRAAPAWEERFAALCAANGLGGADARVRITLTRGTGGHVGAPEGLVTTRLVTADALPGDVDAREESGLAAWPVRLMRHPDHAEHKTLALLPSVLAHRWMRARGGNALDEPLFVSPEGWLLEGATSNLFVRRADGALLTPPLSRPILPGVTRAALLELCAEAREADLTLDDLRGAQEAFFTRSTRGVSPIVRLERAPVGDGRPGPRTLAARAAYAALVTRELGV
ncbi:MAG TPA: aminotransferase class IV [Myxococcota bacterium]|jgi:branched-subunit amino acid aminotransferase/4-amino-4-deoxychorismate lyase|nr:aminotransferase class IV [Myxococcota bacterium]